MGQKVWGYMESAQARKTLKIGPWIKDRILLIDLGFYKHQIFARINENGGFFVSRVKDKVDPLIVGTNRRCRGRTVDIVGKKLSEVLPKLKRQVLDVNRGKFQTQKVQWKTEKRFQTFSIGCDIRRRG